MLSRIVIVVAISHKELSTLTILDYWRGLKFTLTVLAKKGLDMITPKRTSEFLPAVRVRHSTEFGHIHVTVVVETAGGTDHEHEVEVFAQMGHSGEQTYADLEGMCRLASLYLRAGGELVDVARQLLGIGSNLSSDAGKNVSVANSLGEALQLYLEAKKVHGVRALLLGECESSLEK